MKIARVIFVLATLVSIVFARKLELSKDLTGLFPQTTEASMLARVSRAFGGGDVALVLLRGDHPDRVESAATAIAEDLAKASSVERVMTGPPQPAHVDPTAAWRFAGPLARQRLAHAVTPEGMRERLRDTRALLLAPGASDAAEALASDPLRLSMIPWEDAIEIAAGAKGVPGGSFVADGGRARLVVVTPKGRAFDPGAAKEFTDEAESVLERIRKTHEGVRLDLAGGHVVARQTEAMMRSDLEKSGALSLVLAALAFVVTFRRVRALLAVLPPLLCGTLWTIALAALVYPKLSAVATAFTAVVVGVGVDTGVHVYAKLLEARRAGLDPSRAATVARSETAKPTLGAALAAGAAFACLAISDVEGMRQLGVLCAAGEVLTALAILLVVPEIGALLERGAPPAALRLTWLAALTKTRARSMIALGLGAAMIAVAILAGVPRIDHAIVTPDARTLPALATYDAVYATFGGTKGQLFVVSSDRERADAVAEAAETLLAQKRIAGFDALGRLAPSPAVQRARLAERDKLDLPARKADLARVLEEAGFALDAFEGALASFEHPTTNLRDPIDDERVAWAARRHLAKDEHGTMVVTYVRLLGDAAADSEARTLLRAADPSAVLTGFADLERGLVLTMQRDLPRVFALALGIVLVVLAFALRRPAKVAIALVVLLVEIAIVLVLARPLGVRWHLYDALVLPVLLGITLDEALFLLDASAKKSIDDALAEQAPLGASTALTTAAGFGALVACRFDGLVDTGKVGALGSIAGLACALVFIPAGLRLASRALP